MTDSPPPAWGASFLTCGFVGAGLTPTCVRCPGIAVRRPDVHDSPDRDPDQPSTAAGEREALRGTIRAAVR